MTYIPPRTFGDLLRGYPSGRGGNQCAFCKKCAYELGDFVYSYSTRHYVCASCIAPRKDVVLPRVLKREALTRRLDALDQDRE